MEITLHATVKGRLWGGQRARLEVDKPLRRDKPLKLELAQILRGCGDFDGGAKAFTEDSYIRISRPSTVKRGMAYTQCIGLCDLPSIEHLME